MVSFQIHYEGEPRENMEEREGEEGREGGEKKKDSNI